MKIFIHELKSRWRAMLGWSLAMLVLITICMIKYGTLSGDVDATKQLMSALPPTVQAVFGMTGLDAATLAGYYGMCFIFIAVMLAVHAGMLGAGLLAGEEIDKTAEFLYVRPVSRLRVITEKILAGFVMVAIMWVVTVAGSFASFMVFAPGHDMTKEMWLFAAVFAILQTLFFLLGTLSAAITSNPKNAARFVAGAVFASYIFSMLHNLSSNLAWLKYLSPFAYFEATTIVNSGSLEIVYVFVCIALALFSLAATYILYIRRDLEV